MTAVITDTVQPQATVTSETLAAAAALVRQYPYLSDLKPAVFDAAIRDHASSTVGCDGGPHCWITLKARQVLQTVGARP